MSSLCHYRARFVLPVDRPPLADGVVSVAGGRIVSVAPYRAATAPASELIDLGEAVLIPGLVNAHTHLEFSLLEAPLGAAGESFARWIERVVTARREQFAAGADLVALAVQAARAGLRELAACGTSAVGEIATQPWYAGVAPPADMSLVIFRELLGLAPERAETQYAVARDFLADLASRTGADCIAPGLSPHAPYTVHPELLAAAVTASAQRKLPVALHLAESWAELELLQSHCGELVEVLERLGAWFPGALPRGLRPRDFLEQLSTAHRALVVHGNFLTTSDLQYLAQERDVLSLVYCPRTHSRFPHGAYPLAEALAAGVRVALGTDSRASNPDLSLWREMQFVAQQHPAVDPEQIVTCGTLAGAEALGLAAELGSLTPGKRARLAAIPLPAKGDSWQAVLHAPVHSAPPSNSAECAS